MERRGVKIHWLEGQLHMEEKLEKALELFQAAQIVEGNSI
jgi:hypothetical protein